MMTSISLLGACLLVCAVFSITHVHGSKGQSNVKTVPVRVVYKGEATLWCDEFSDHLRPRQNKEDDDDDDDDDREEQDKERKQEKEFASKDEQVRDSEWKDFAFYKKITEARKPEDGSDDQAEPIVRIEKIEEDDEKYFIHQSENKLTIKNLRRADMIGVEYFCNSSVNNSHINFKTLIKPYLMSPEKQSATVMRNENAELICKLLYGAENDQKVEWIWKRGDQKLVENENGTVLFEYGEEEIYSKLLLRNVTEEMKGEYKCIAKNKYGFAENVLKLRVKNPWAPLWPVFGIIIQLIILAIVISCCSRKEKRRRLPSS